MSFAKKFNKRQKTEHQPDPQEKDTTQAQTKDKVDKKQIDANGNEVSTDESITSLDLEIRPIKTSKDKIKQPELSEKYIIPRLNTSSIFNGTTGQGKSTLVTNLVADPRFFGANAFDFKFLISPTAEGDDVQKELKIKKPFVISDLTVAPYILKNIMTEQKKLIKEKGNHKAPQILLIFDDIVSHPDFLRTDEFVRCFIACRHYNFTTFLCSQSWTACPRRCRLQATNIFFFASPQSEIDLLCEEYCPPGLKKDDFHRMVEFATMEPRYSFLYINKSVPFTERYRKNLDYIIPIEQFKSQEDGGDRKRGRKGSESTDSEGDEQHSGYEFFQHPGYAKSESNTTSSSVPIGSQTGSGPESRKRQKKHIG